MAEDKIEAYNKSITRTKYFKMDDAINSPICSKTVFIIANERITKENRIGRYYTVFPSFKKFLKKRDSYPHCHEIIIDHINNKTNIAGRLVFDFDIKITDSSILKDTGLIDKNDNQPIMFNSKTLSITKIPLNFKQQIENTIIETIDQYFHDIDKKILEFIWSTSQNPNKFSKHLTVKNLYFDDWITMSKLFYKLFCKIWDNQYYWISSKDLVDSQIVRNKGSLRMVGSTKINGYPLVFDNKNHTLPDSLIRIYFRNHREKEQLVTRNNINKDIINQFLESNDDIEHHRSIDIIDRHFTKIRNPSYDPIIYQKAFEIYDAIHPNIFKMGKVNGKYLTLIRLKPHKCFLSNKFHEQENAYLYISMSDTTYKISFGCYRFCSKKKMEYLGSLIQGNLMKNSPYIDDTDDTDGTTKKHDFNINIKFLSDSDDECINAPNNIKSLESIKSSKSKKQLKLSKSKKPIKHTKTKNIYVET
ncbi:hypothetical protein [Acanthamoeba polyphaga mimivirus]|nr:hypothetical protein [Acanthamoeba castellanii mamavirus]UMZ07935.1 hypothetical protein [Acanthamoeba polyphaga mimivirus]